MPSSCKPTRNGGTLPRTSKESSANKNSTDTANYSSPHTPGSSTIPLETLSSRLNSTLGSSSSTGSRVKKRCAEDFKNRNIKEAVLKELT